eukprot:gene1545-15994_t
MPLTERQQMALLLEMSAKEFQEQKKDKTKKSGETSGNKRSGSSKGEMHKINKRNKRGETQLHLAAIKGDVDGVRSLIKKGADVNITDHADWTPLHEACSRGHYKVVKMLLKAGANVNAKGLEGDTPLHDASSNGHLKIAKILLKFGADPSRKNYSLENPLDVSASTEVDALLEEFASLAEIERENYAFSTESSSESSSEDDVSSVRSSDIDHLQSKSSSQKRIISDDDEDSDDDDIELSRISEMVKRKKLAMAEESGKAKQPETGILVKGEGESPRTSTPKHGLSEIPPEEKPPQKNSPFLKKVEGKRKFSENDREVSVGRPRKKYKRNDKKISSASNFEEGSSPKGQGQDSTRTQPSFGTKENDSKNGENIEKESHSGHSDGDAKDEKTKNTKSSGNNPYISDISDAEEEEEGTSSKSHDKITSDMFRANIFTNVLDRLSDHGSLNEPSLSPVVQSDAALAQFDGEKKEHSKETKGDCKASSILESEITDSLSQRSDTVLSKIDSGTGKIQSSPEESDLQLDRSFETNKANNRKTAADTQGKKARYLEDGTLSADSGSEERKTTESAAKPMINFDSSNPEALKKKKDKKIKIPSLSGDQEAESHSKLSKKNKKDEVSRDVGETIEKSISKDISNEGVKIKSAEKLLKKSKKKRKEEMKGEETEDSSRFDFSRKGKDKDNCSKFEDRSEPSVAAKVKIHESGSDTLPEKEEPLSPIQSSKPKSFKGKFSDKTSKGAIESQESKNDEKGKEIKSHTPVMKKKIKIIQSQTSSNERFLESKADLSKEEEVNSSSGVETQSSKNKNVKIDQFLSSSSGRTLSEGSKDNSTKSSLDVAKKVKKEPGAKSEKTIKPKDSLKEIQKDQKKILADKDGDPQRGSPEKQKKSSQAKKFSSKLKDGKSEFKKMQDSSRESEKSMSKDARKNGGKEVAAENSRDNKVISGDSQLKASPVKESRGTSLKELKTTPVKGRRESKEIDLKIWDFGLQKVAPPKVVKMSKIKEQKRAQLKENKAKKECDLKATDQQQTPDKLKKTESASKNLQSSVERPDNKESKSKEPVESKRESKTEAVLVTENAVVGKPAELKEDEKKSECNKKLESIKAEQQDEADKRDNSSLGLSNREASLGMGLDLSNREAEKSGFKEVRAPEEIDLAGDKAAATEDADRNTEVEMEHIGKIALEASDAVSMDSPSTSQVKLETTLGSTDPVCKVTSSKEEIPSPSLQQSAEEEFKCGDAVPVEADKQHVKNGTEDIDKQHDNGETLDEEDKEKVSSNEAEVKMENSDGLLLNDFGAVSDLEDHLGPFHGTKLEETDIDIKELSNPEDTLKMLTQEMHRQGAPVQESKVSDQETHNVTMTGHDFTILSEQINEKIKHLSSRSFVSELSEEEKHIVNISMEMAENLSQDADHDETRINCNSTEDDSLKFKSSEMLKSSNSEHCTSPSKELTDLEQPISHSEGLSCNVTNENNEIIPPATNLSSSTSDITVDVEKHPASTQSSPAVSQTSSSLVSSHLPVSARMSSTRSRTVDLEPRGIAQVVADIDLNSIPRCMLESGKPPENAAVSESESGLQTPSTPNMNVAPATDEKQTKESAGLLTQDSNSSSNSSSIDRLKRKSAVQGQSLTWRKAMFNEHHFTKLSVPKHFHDFSLITADYWQEDPKNATMTSDIEHKEVKELKESHAVELKRLHLCMEQELVRVESRYQSMCKNRKVISACSTVMYQKLEQYSKLNMKSTKKTQEEASVSNEEVRRNAIKEVLDKYIKKEEDMFKRQEQELAALDRRIAVEKIQRLSAEELLRRHCLRERIL